MTATDKTPSLYVDIDKLDATTAAFLAAKLREHSFDSIYGFPGIDAVDHRAAMLADGTESHKVTLSLKGREQVTAALDVLAARWSEVPNEMSGDDLLALVNATTESVEAGRAVKEASVKAAKKRTRRETFDSFAQFLGYWVLAMALLYGVTYALYAAANLITK